VSISVVIPIYNERDNIDLCHEQLTKVLVGFGREYELIFVDDGSRDGSSAKLAALAADDRHVKVVEFRRNFGQTAAMQAGLQHASLDYVVTIDGDLQNDPTDIPMMVERLEEGYDLVHGWRKNRQDALVNRKLPSKMANWLISKVTGFPIHDLGCTLKVMRREIAQELRLYGDMHRFIPILAHWQGAKSLEVETKHHARRFGTTKYGIWRTVRVILDLMTVKFLTQYVVSPMRLFGGVGLIAMVGGLAAGAATALMKLVGGIDMTGNPLLLLSVLGLVVGVQFFALGLLGEMGARTFFVAQDRPPYTVRRRLNFDAPPAVPITSRRAA
jgi:glycosyltransferase involved in cell wall biosynthesis